MPNNLRFGFVAVHAGAGYHPRNTRPATSKACEEACRTAYSLLVESDGQCPAVDACVAATISLENDPSTNAGVGSNLTIREMVECDAGLMDGRGRRFAGVGCVRNVKNPIAVAKKLLDLQNDHGALVPPTLLAGNGATEFAKECGLEIVFDADLVTRKSLATYRKALQMVSSIGNDVRAVSDTVGVIVVNRNGDVAASCSSGGPLLKLPGRIGHSAHFGCGSWASNASDVGLPSVAASCTGCGEYLVRASLAKNIGERLLMPNVGNIAADVIASSLRSDFLDSPLLLDSDVHRRIAGAIALKTEFVSSTEFLIDFAYGHCSKNLCLAYTAADFGGPGENIRSVMSECPDGSKVCASGSMLKLINKSS